MTNSFSKACRGQHSKSAAFSLLELLLALSLGISLSGVILQILISESNLGLRFNRLLRERGVQQRTLALIREDVMRSSRISTDPQQEQHACSMAGRLPVLHLSTASGQVTYSVGTAPSPIWRGQVLMRCGPAFDLLGQPSAGTSAQNRVLIDGLALNPEPWRKCPRLATDQIDLSGSAAKSFSACLKKNSNTLAIRLIQQFGKPGKVSQAISRETLISSAI